MPWASDPLEPRRREREALIALARDYVNVLGRRVELVCAVVVGSVARGDFNAWSDVDVLVVSEDLPFDALARLDLLHSGRPPRVEPHGYTPAEFRRALTRQDPLVREGLDCGVALAGQLPNP